MWSRRSGSPARHWGGGVVEIPTKSNKRRVIWWALVNAKKTWKGQVMVRRIRLPERLFGRVGGGDVVRIPTKSNEKYFVW